MGYELLDFGHPPSEGWPTAPTVQSRLNILELESPPPTQWASRAMTAGQNRRHHRKALVIVGVVATLGLAWMARLPESHTAAADAGWSGVATSWQVTSRLTGPPSAPMLLLHNGTPKAVRVSVDPASEVQQLAAPGRDASPVGAAGPNVAVTSDPELPVVLFADQTIAVLLQVRLHGCQADPTEGFPHFLELSGAPVSTSGSVSVTEPRIEPTLVDVTSLVVWARGRACG